MKPHFQYFRMPLLLADGMGAALRKKGPRHVPMAALRSDYIGRQYERKGFDLRSWHECGFPKRPLCGGSRSMTGRPISVSTRDQNFYDSFGLSSFLCTFPVGLSGFSARCFCAAACCSASARKATVCSFFIA